MVKALTHSLTLVFFSAKLLSMENSSSSSLGDGLKMIRSNGVTTESEQMRFARLLEVAQKAKKIQVKSDNTGYRGGFPRVDKDDLSRIITALKKGFGDSLRSKDVFDGEQTIVFDPVHIDQFLYFREESLHVKAGSQIHELDQKDRLIEDQKKLSTQKELIIKGLKLKNTELERLISANSEITRLAELLTLQAQKITVKNESSKPPSGDFQEVTGNDVANFIGAIKTGFQDPINSKNSLDQKETVSFTSTFLNQLLYSREEPFRTTIKDLKLQVDALTKDHATAIAQVAKSKEDAINNLNSVIQKQASRSFLIGLGIGSIPTLSYIGIKAWAWFQERK